MAGTGSSPLIPNDPPQTNGPHSNQPVGTEYTLQGVMRFLQLEWHRHERERNAWEIEKAELKQRLAKLEGEHRSSRKLEESSNLRVRMLERAVLNERKRVKLESNGKPTEQERGYGGTANKLNEGIYAKIESGRSRDSSSKAERKYQDEPESSVKPAYQFEDLLADLDGPFRDEESMETSAMHAERALQEVNYITSIAAIHPPTPPHPPIQSSELDQGLFPRRPISINGQSALQQALDESFSQRHPMSVMDHLQDGPLALRPAIPAPPLSLDLFDFSAPHPSPAPPNPQPPHSQAPPRPRNVHNPFTRSETAYGGIGQTLPPPPPHPFNDARSKKDSSQFYRGRQPSDPPLKFLPEEIESSGMGWAMSKPSDSVNKSDSKLKDNTNRPPYEHQQPAARQIFGSSPEKGYGNNVGGWDFGDDSSAPNSIAFPSTPSSQDSTAAHQPHEEPFPPPASHRFDGSMARRKSGHSGTSIFDKAILSQTDPAPQNTLFKLRFALRGHLDTVRAIIFTGGGSLSEPEIASASDDGCIKRWIIPASYGSTTAFPPPPSLPNAEHPPPQRLVHNFPNLDIQAEFTHRAHSGIATCLAACPSDVYSAHGRAQGDGWIFSGGSDGEIRVWERGRVDPKAVLNGHEDAVWALCVLPSDCISPPSLTDSGGNFVGEILGLGIQGETVILISGSADGTVKVWLCSAPPPPPMHSRHGSVSSQFGSGRRGAGGSRRHSVSSGSNYPTSPQPNYRSTSSFEHELIHTITRLSTDGQDGKIPAPTCITPLGTSGEHFVVSYDDASIIVYSVKTGDEVSSLQSQETYNGSPKTGVNKIVTVTGGALGQQEDEEGGPTGERGGLEGIVMAVHEDRYLRFYDANSGQNTYTTLAHPQPISSLSVTPLHHPSFASPASSSTNPSSSSSIGELVTSSHDSSIRLWSLATRSCTQEIIAHRRCQGSGVMDVAWSRDGRWIVSCGGDGVIKVFGR